LRIIPWPRQELRVLTRHSTLHFTIFSQTGFHYIGFMWDIFRSSKGRRHQGRAADKRGSLQGCLRIWRLPCPRGMRTATYKGSETLLTPQCRRSHQPHMAYRRQYEIISHRLTVAVIPRSLIILRVISCFNFIDQPPTQDTISRRVRQCSNKICTNTISSYLESVWRPTDSTSRELTSFINSGASNVHRSQTC
jgi:hypothetical protein